MTGRYFFFTSFFVQISYYIMLLNKFIVQLDLCVFEKFNCHWYYDGCHFEMHYVWPHIHWAVHFNYDIICFYDYIHLPLFLVDTTSNKRAVAAKWRLFIMLCGCLVLEVFHLFLISLISPSDYEEMDWDASKCTRVNSPCASGSFGSV